MTLVAVEPGPGREALLPILLLADDAEDHVRAHLDEGFVYALSIDDGEAGGGDGRGSTPVGAVQAVDRGEGTVELTLVAVDEAHQARGLGKRLVALVLDELRHQGFRRSTVGTSNAGVNEIAFYQKCGFRLLSIERDYFNEARGYDGTAMENGIVHRDLVWFDQSLA